jgi:uncharacterized protein
MAISPKHLVVKKSTIPGSGKGLFTKTFIPAGTRIVEYTGRISSWKDANHVDGENAYIYYVTRNHVIDAKSDMRSLARYANDAKGLTKVKGISNNCEYVEEKHRVFIHAKKDIPAGGEILVPYGPEYWDVIKHNLKLSREEDKKAKKTKRGSTSKSTTKSKPATKNKDSVRKDTVSRGNSVKNATDAKNNATGKNTASRKGNGTVKSRGSVKSTGNVKRTGSVKNTGRARNLTKDISSDHAAKNISATGRRLQQIN